MFEKYKKNITTFLLCLAIILTQALPNIGTANIIKAAETSTFNGASGTSGSLNWNITPEGHLTITGNGDYKKSLNSINLPEWAEYSEYIKTAEVNVKNITSTTFMFYRCSNLTSLNLSNLDTSNVTNMYYMFAECHSLTSLDLSSFDTSNVTNMHWMFQGCNSLTSLDLSKFDTSNVTDMSGMFHNCNSLTSLDLSNFDTSNVTNMSEIFDSCNNLTSLDLSNFNTSGVTNMNRMFFRCNSLTSLNLNNFNTSNVTKMNNMFSGCANLTSLDLSNFNTSNVIDMGNMFGCASLTSLDLSNFDTSNVTKMNSMFSGCASLTSLDLSNFNTSNVTNMSGMFYRCSSLTSLGLSNFNTSNVTNMAGIFYGCSSLTSLNLSNFNTSSVTNMANMFFRCSSLTSLNLSNFDTSSVTNMGSMFDRCSSLTSLDLSNFDTSSVTNMYSMFDRCSSLTSLDLSNFDTNNISVGDFIYHSDYFSIKELNSLDKLYFFADSSYEYELPSSDGYYWTDENGNTFTKTAKYVAKKVIYTKSAGSNLPSPPPTSVPSASPTDTPVITFTPAPTITPGDDINTGIYYDSSCTSLAAISTRTHFVNGGNVKQAGNNRINYKSKTYYTKLQASDIVTVNKKGKTVTKKGKLVAGITIKNEKPSLVKGKTSKDTSASKIAKVSISKGKIKVTAQKQPGSVYLWVMDTGDAGTYVCAKINIKTAPSKVQIFSKSSNEEGFSADKKNVYKKDLIELGSSIKLYVYPSYKQNGQFVETKDASYSASANIQAASYFKVTQDKNNPCCFIVTATALKNNKKTFGKIIIKCNENGKKAVFTATAINSIQGISLGSANGINDVTSGNAITSYTINRSDTDKKTGSFVISTTKSSSNFETTDKVKLYAMGSDDGFDKAMMKKGRVKITTRPSGNQKKLTAKLGSDKKTITVTAAKKIPAGTSVYYLIFYNNKENKGYKTIKITTE